VKGCAGKRTFAAYCFAAATATPAFAQSVTVEATGDIGPALTAKIAEYGLPVIVTVAPNKTLLDAVVALCGNNSTYLSLIGTERLKATATVARAETIPACVRPASPAVDTVRSGDNLTKLLARNGFSEQSGLSSWPVSTQQAITLACAGTDACKTEDSSRWESATTDTGFEVNWLRSNLRIDGLGDRIASLQEGKAAGVEPGKAPVSRDMQETALVVMSHNEFAKLANRNIVNTTVADPNKLSPGMDILVPFKQPEYSTVYLKDAATLPAVIADLQRVAAESAQPPTFTSSGDALLVSPLEDGCEGTPPEYRPFSGEDVIRQIGLNYRLGGISPPKSRKNVLVLDTGLDEDIVKDAVPFPGSYFHRMARPQGVSPVAHGAGDSSVFGFNFATRQDVVQSPEGFSDRWHGLNVVGAILGGAELEDYRYAVDLPVGVAIGSLMSFAGGEARIEPNSLSASLNAIRTEPGSISVINASFMAGRPIDGLRRAADNAEGVLLVVAAGNEPRDLEGWSIWPARYGGDPANSSNLTTITVGGHRPDGSIWPKSAWSSKYVDLLAPACHVPTYTGVESPADQSGLKHISAERAVETGTSLSAPIVSMVATILSSYGLRPYEIKQRMTFASDFDSALIDKTFSSGRLNIRRTLAFPLDVAIWNEHGKKRESYFRDSFSSSLAVSICGKLYAAGRLGKLSRYRKENGDEMVRFWLKSENQDTPQLFGYKECTIAESSNTVISLQGVAGSSENIDIPISRLIDFVPAFSR